MLHVGVLNQRNAVCGGPDLEVGVQDSFWIPGEELDVSCVGVGRV